MGWHADAGTDQARRQALLAAFAKLALADRLLARMLTEARLVHSPARTREFLTARSQVRRTMDRLRISLHQVMAEQVITEAFEKDGSAALARTCPRSEIRACSLPAQGSSMATFTLDDPGALEAAAEGIHKARVGHRILSLFTTRQDSILLAEAVIEAIEASGFRVVRCEGPE